MIDINNDEEDGIEVLRTRSASEGTKPSALQFTENSSTPSKIGVKKMPNEGMEDGESVSQL